MNINKIKDKKENQKRSWYVFCFIASFCVCIVLNTLFFHIEIVKGESMNPTLQDKDIEISIKSYWVELKRGDIINIESTAAGENIVKRIIGIEGDQIVSKNGVIHINGQIINETYLLSSEDFNDNFEVKVPSGHVFVMGDNRGNSLDSRTIGTIPIEEIKSKLLFTLGSKR